jgi:hypothetical protein
MSDLAKNIIAAGINYHQLIFNCDDKNLLHTAAKEILAEGIIGTIDPMLAMSIDDDINRKLFHLP